MAQDPRIVRALKRPLRRLPRSKFNATRRYMTKPPPPADCIDCDTACEILGYARTTLYRKINEGVFTIYPAMPNYFVMSRAEVNAYIPPEGGNPKWRKEGATPFMLDDAALAENE